jgi:uncharacterized membrane protein
LKRIVKYFLNGLLFIIPLAVSIYLVYFVFTKVDGLLGLKIPGIGFVITIALVIFIGFLGSNLLTKGLLGIVDSVFKKLPFIKLIYTSVKDLVSAFVGDKKKFDKPVFVTLSKDTDIKIVGFITKDSLKELGLENHLAVYLPQSYGFAGSMIVVPADQVIPIDADSADVMAFIISGGITGKKVKA